MKTVYWCMSFMQAVLRTQTGAGKLAMVQKATWKLMQPMEEALSDHSDREFAHFA